MTRGHGRRREGSASHDAEDRCSDSDLFFAIADGIALDAVVGDWTNFMCDELGSFTAFDLADATPGLAGLRLSRLSRCRRWLLYADDGRLPIVRWIER